MDEPITKREVLELLKELLSGSTIYVQNCDSRISGVVGAADLRKRVEIMIEGKKEQ